MNKIIMCILLFTASTSVHAAEWMFSTEALLWRPLGADRTIAAALNTGLSKELTLPYSPGYRLRAGYDIWYVSWMDLQSHANGSAACPGGTCNGALPLDDFASAAVGLRLQTLDLGMRAHLIDSVAGKDLKVIGELSFRYARLYEKTATTEHSIIFGSTFFQNIRANTSMYGPHLGLEADGRLLPKLRLVGSTGFSLFDSWGQFDSLQTGPTTVSGNWRELVPELELALKLVALPTQNIKIWLGYDFLDFIDAIPFHSIPGFGSLNGSSIQFSGPSLGASLTF